MTDGRTGPIADELRRRGLAAPAIVLLDAHRPLRPLLGLAATFLFPVMRPLLGGTAERIRATLDHPEAYDELLAGLRRGAGD